MAIFSILQKTGKHQSHGVQMVFSSGILIGPISGCRPRDVKERQ